MKKGKDPQLTMHSEASVFNGYRIWDTTEQRYLHIGYDTRAQAIRALKKIGSPARYQVKKTSRG